jgi:hypothetical protein
MFLAACSDSTSPTIAGKNIEVSAAVSAAGNPIVTEAEIARQTENNPTPTNNWVFFTRAADASQGRTGAGSGTFVIGPATAPLGVGSFNKQTPDGSAKVYLFNFDHIGVAISSITAINYSTYISTPGSDARQAPSINIQIDKNGGTFETGDFATLVFEPVYNTTQGNVAVGSWQTWDAIRSGTASWWATGGSSLCPPAGTFCTWADVLSRYPGATIVGGFGINQGSGNGGLNASVDGLTLGVTGTTTTYDFEPYVTATSRQSCMNGGWTSVKRADGSSFKNQGDCVSYLNTGN